MINKDNIKELLLNLNFKQIAVQEEMFSNVFLKEFPETNAYLKVDLDNGELIYPEDKGLKINIRTTCNFSQNENFVVFECVHRLFCQGYRSEHIELEPMWKLGHEAKSGRADILVKDQTNKPLLIVECKTPGKEFEKEWENMKENGGQLFSYFTQEKSTRFICLYASDFVNNDVSFQNFIITTTDNQNLVEKFDKKPNKPLFYKNAANAKELFQVWNETYNSDYSTQGIFGDEFQPYNIGTKKISLNNLDKITKRHIQGKYNEFATILRQHNVSGRENAFDKLVNLFLCKIVDETTNPNDLKLYWKGEYFDNYFDLLDRLQSLYKDGMKTFLEDEVTYIDFQTIKDTFKFYSNDRDATQEKILEHFKKQKYFTNNDFSFIDVHNEKLFYQNADVLLKIIKMWQDFQINGDQQNQFLGDMFECFLDKGVKQSEGQFFTPMPICKFIISSLPLENLVVENQDPPLVIDYACGAGHFLTELAAQIKPYVEKHKQVSVKEYYSNIFGIEKEYRLSKVAKVSAFMYSQKEINITYADALAQNEKFKDNSFSVLVANPPYSVKGFLKTLSDEDISRYNLTGTIDEKSYERNNTIETYFIERAKQLLKSSGVAGIILPTSILSRGSKKSTSDKENTYVATREILLKYFEIVAVVELGSGTFGKTGTTTAILFLRKRDDNPEPSEHYSSRVESWFNNDNSRNNIYEDEFLIKKYCEHIEIDYYEYKTLLAANPSDDLLNYDIFKEYINDFENSKDTKDLKESYLKQIENLERTISAEFKKDSKKTKTILNDDDFKQKLSEEIKKRKSDLENELEKVLLKNKVDFIKSIEKDKLLYFILAFTNRQNVLIVKSPSENRDKKKFLGYEWSTRKGDEGIKYFGASVKPARNEDDEVDDLEESEDVRILSNLDALSNIQTPLYDNDDPYNPEKINYYIQQNFLGKDFEIPDNLKSFVSYSRLVDMLDFKRKNFDKVISLNPKKVISINTKWDMVKIGSICKLYQPQTITKDDLIDNGKFKVYGANGIIGNYNKFNHEKSEVVITCRGATCGTINLTEPFSWITGNAMVAQPFNENQIIKKYLFEILKFSNLSNTITGSAQPQITKEKLSPFEIPLPPKDIQQKIVEECKDVDKEVEIYKKELELFNREKEKLFISINFEAKKLYEISDEIFAGGDKPEEFSEIKTNKYNIPIYSNSSKNMGLFGYTNIAKVTKQCLTVSARGTIGYTVLRNEPFFPIVRLIVIIPNNNIISPKYLEFILNSYKLNNSGSNIPQLTVPEISKLEIPVPSLSEQEQLVKEIEELEKQISSAETLINESSDKKNEIIKKYL